MYNARRLALLAPLAALPLLVSGCTSDSGTEDGTVDVMASFYPLEFIAEQVGGDRVDVRSVTPPGAEPHDVELSPAQVARIDGADLMLYLSGFQPAVDDAVAQTSPGHVVDAASDTTLLAADEHHEDETAEEHQEHDHGELDPHFWLDPSRMPAVVDDVATALSEIDPEGADTYAANAAALNQRFEDLDAAYAAGLQQCGSRTFVTSHDAFGYLADRYDLDQVGISGIDPDAEPSPARLAEVKDIVRDEGVSTIFFESLVSPKVAQTLAADLGIDAAVLDPLEGVTEPDADYFSVAEANLDALRMALSCS
ncbi:metal ABC transporter substrate-binding protein [Cellulomonas fengjieae]|uniref:Zinc ABC transporter substrate-binding protein n=1 Tax=Cellulomonas fengjieae TaxID=2819978 RepID=A0ABS3SGD5_9CELL|nr:metal ABC transporter substrate-binding protein [Cellulomonas fengjieae]MBO3084021.1 zinc ABC transporter substrate-binding protein [Cellulomonas fengjieae]QVI64718.1 zinc ABC transporter substrate-binding protein [Cellulomonas fengjieae]